MKRKGFTLIEVMIVLAIVAVLSAVAIPLYTGYTNRAKQVEAEEQLMNIAAIEADYFNSFRKYLIGSWKTTDEDTTILTDYYGAKLKGDYYTIDITNLNGFTAKACVCYTGQTCCDLSCTVDKSNSKPDCKKE
ncbi:prepilin-type N-terminal cleavage/methylation domain-containing protein [bacterium]|nr:prepilin-type N-terminal cleavage/methylation domain-containing protein [bacterium]